MTNKAIAKMAKPTADQPSSQEQAAVPVRSVRRVGYMLVGAALGGALALGSVAIGSMAIGTLAIGRFAAGRVRLGRVEIEDLVVRRSRSLP